MALVSPGLEVQVIDESTYLASAVSTIPLVLVATQENKIVNGQIATGTTKDNAGKLAVVTSQRELVNLFGFPEFKRSAIGTALHGDELNEYGLMAAYSALGVGNRAYVVRADIDLSKIEGTPNRPVGEPSSGSYWHDMSESDYGIFQWDEVSKKFTKIVPRVITAVTQVVEDGGIYKPRDSVGATGEYAVVITESDSTIRGFYKGLQNSWSLIGSSEWKRSVPTIVGTKSGVSLEEGNVIAINNTLVTVEVGQTDVVSFSLTINATNIPGVTAGTRNGNLVIYVDDSAASDGYVVDGKISVSNVFGSALFDLGIEEVVERNSPSIQVSGYTSVPTWAIQNNVPTGSIWVKTTAVGSGMDISLKQYDSDLSVWTPVASQVFTNHISPSYSTSVTVGSPYGVVNAKAFPFHELKVMRRTQETTEIKFTPSSPFVVGDQLGVVVSGQMAEVNSYCITMTGTTSDDFVSDIQEKNITELTVNLDPSGEITITHKYGGVINLFDIYGSVLNSAGINYSLENTWPIKDFYGVVANADVDTLFSRAAGTQYYVGTKPSNGLTSDDRYLDIKRGIEYHWSEGDERWNVSGELYDFYVSDSRPSVSHPERVNLWLDEQNGRLYMSDESDWNLIWASGNSSVGVYASGAEPLTYVFGNSAPTTRPNDGDMWYYNDRAEVDIMINTGTEWRGYRSVAQDIRGYNLSLTDPNGVIVSASEPTEQSSGNPLVNGDLWLDSSDVKNYPRIYRRTSDQSWELIDKSDQTSESGIIFADMRWGISGDIDPSRDPLPSIQSLTTNSYTDLDAPDPRLYPTGILAFNLRRSGFSIKRYVRNYFNSVSFPNVQLPTFKDTWVTASGLQNDGSMFAGPQAQRNMVVSAMKSAIDTNETIREDQWQFSLIAAPGYPELIGNMVALNKDRSESAFVIGDTPMDLSPNMVEITNWMNSNLTIPDPFLGVFYPSGLSNDLSGNEIAVPPSHMMLRTIMRSDNVSFPWFAPAGARRGLVDNASTIGTIDPETGEFGRFSVNKGLRDALYEAKINPLTILPGTGLLNYGQKTRYGLTSALDRINVARLINYIRTALQPLANNFLFEPNDKIVRDQIKQSVEGLMNDLVAKRALYDYLVVVDESNNTPDRIARNELYVDIAIAPVRTVEFIYIPLRIRNPGDI